MSTSIFRSLDLAGRALSAQRQRLDATSSNLANAQTTRVDGVSTPYQRRDVVLAANLPKDGFGAVLAGSMESNVRAVEVVEVKESDEYVEVHDPSHPDADPATGIVKMPKVDTVREMVDMITTMRTYQANLNVLSSVREMAQRALAIGRNG